MATKSQVGRFLSCRGVAFEIKPHSDPFALPTTTIHPSTYDHHGSKRLQHPPWESHFSSTVFDMVQRTTSRPSSHFCDLEVDEEEEEDGNEDDEYMVTSIEEGVVEEEEEEKVSVPLRLPSSRSKRGLQPSKVGRKRDSRLSIILLDQGLFTVYKRLFAVSLCLNFIGALILAITGEFPYARDKAVLFSVGNILALTLCRSEAFLRVVFWLAVVALGRSWVPIRVKIATTALLQSLGGIHSGCGVSSIAWLVYALVLTLRDRQSTSPAIIGVAASILFLLFLTSLAAFPLVRHLHHNVFERTHRFAGWTALALLWAFIFLTISYDPRTKSYSHDRIGSSLVRQQEFWFTLAITTTIILPWTTVRRVQVSITTPSNHASIIKFQGGVQAGILGRISPSPMSEWHAFGIISDNKTEHMMLAGAVGDFTKSLVSNPPSHLWVRQLHFSGLPYLVNMYERVVLVATGSGICVFLSFLLQPCRADVCLVWVAKGIEQNFGKEIKDWVSGYHKDKVIVHDTAVLGRPNVSQLSVSAAKNWGAQVVIVTSNPEGSRDIVRACKKAGVPAFGPIWDS